MAGMAEKVFRKVVFTGDDEDACPRRVGENDKRCLLLPPLADAYMHACCCWHWQLQFLKVVAVCRATDEKGEMIVRQGLVVSPLLSMYVGMKQLHESIIRRRGCVNDVLPRNKLGVVAAAVDAVVRGGWFLLSSALSSSLSMSILYTRRMVRVILVSARRMHSVLCSKWSVEN